MSATASGLVDRTCDAVARRRDAQPLDQFAELVPILGQVDGLGRRAQDRHTGGLQAVGQVERRLPAVLDDDAGQLSAGPFALDNVEHILEGQRLEVEPVAGVVVGAHRLRVAVDHDRLVAQFLQGKAGMAAAVVELDALADAVGPAAQNDHLLAVRGQRFALALIAAVEVGRVGLKLSRTGVDLVVGGEDAELVAEGADIMFGDRGSKIEDRRFRIGIAIPIFDLCSSFFDNPRQLTIAKPQPLGPAQRLLIQRRPGLSRSR